MKHRKISNLLNPGYLFQLAGAITLIPIFLDQFGILNCGFIAGSVLLIEYPYFEYDFGAVLIKLTVGIISLLLLVSGTVYLRIVNKPELHSMGYVLFLVFSYCAAAIADPRPKLGLLWGLLLVVVLIGTKKYWRPMSMVPIPPNGNQQ